MDMRHILSHTGRCLTCDKTESSNHAAVAQRRDVGPPQFGRGHPKESEPKTAESPAQSVLGQISSLVSRAFESRPAAAAAAAASRSEGERLSLPGFGLPVDYSPDGVKGFPHAICDIELVQSLGISKRERRMLAFIGAITDKPEWERKVFDETIVAKWEEEAMSMTVTTVDEKFNDTENNDVFLSEKMFRNCILELRDKATRFKETGLINTIDAEVTVVKSDVNVPRDLQTDLQKAVKVLEDVPESQQDWHPRSDNQVLDLLHPSLFPVIYGRSRVVPTGKITLDNWNKYPGQTELVPEFKETDNAQKHRLPAGWGKFQWLPTDIEWTEAGPKIASYVNNLHPEEHKALYPVLEKFVGAAVPMWEECLSWWNDRRRQVFDRTGDEDDYYLPEGVKYQIPERTESDDGEDEDDDDEAWKWTPEYEDWWEQNRVLSFREPSDFVPFAEQVDLSTRLDFNKEYPQGIQVIFKLANIHLTPEKPKYNGGTWHVEGALNEHICATALYYYDEENITESRLAFRQGVDSEYLIMIPEQSQYTSLEKWLGVENEEVAIQNLGSVLTRPGRMLAFPNALQHQVQPFELVDKTRAGHRKILAMFLVDPNRRVLSTSNVPPQRTDWWAPQVRAVPAFARLPLEIFEHIMDQVEFPLSWKEGLEVREKLMDERSFITGRVEDELNENYFSFCEH